MTTLATPPEDTHHPTKPGFQQRLGLFDATMLVAGSMIGSGIFIVSAGITRDVGSAGWLLFVWVLTGFLTVSGALCYAELAAMMPHAGGQYVYLRQAYGTMPAFLYGWTLFLVIQTGTIAAVGVAFAKFLGVLVPELGTSKEAKALYLDVGPITFTAGQLVGVAVIALLTAVNCLGVREGKWVQNFFTVAKTAALAGLVILGLTVAADWNIWAANTADLWGGMTSTEEFGKMLKVVPFTLIAGFLVISGAMVGSLFSSDAWNNVTFIAGEVKNPRRNLPLSLALGTGLVIGLYLLANIAYLADLPLDGIRHAKDDRVGTAVLERVSPGFGVQLMAVAIMLSTFGCANGLILSGARLYYAMAHDGLFFESVGRLNRHGVPAMGLVLQAIWASLLTFSGKYNELLEFVIFAALLFYVLTVAGLFILRRTQPDVERPYRAVGYPVLPGLYVGLAGALMLGLLLAKPITAGAGLGIVLTGVPVYFFWHRKV
jgi:APA family basic amino acid/polyamine antiporter